MADPPPLPPRPGRAVRTCVVKAPVHGPGPGVHHPTRPLQPLHRLPQRRHGSSTQLNFHHPTQRPVVLPPDTESHVSRIMLPAGPSSHGSRSSSQPTSTLAGISRPAVTAYRPASSSPISSSTHRRPVPVIPKLDFKASDALTLDQLQNRRLDRQPVHNEYIHATPKHPETKVKGGLTSVRTNEKSGKKRVERQTLLSSSPTPAITSQPKGSPYKDNSSTSDIDDNSDELSIKCQQCGGCRCDSCTKDRPLPETYLCGDKCLCSADNVVEYASCVCGVKALFYHCSQDALCDGVLTQEDGDRPCSCSSDNCCLRFSTMSLLCLFLPCLSCYWPLRGCTKAVSSCYSWYHHRRACQCSSNQPQRPGALEHRLLQQDRSLNSTSAR